MFYKRAMYTLCKPLTDNIKEDKPVKGAGLFHLVIRKRYLFVQQMRMRSFVASMKWLCKMSVQPS